MVYKTGKSHNNPSCRTFTLFSCSLQILKLCRVVDSNHSLWLSTSHLTTLRLHMILTKTSTRTDKSSSSQERLISLSQNLIFRRTPFYFVTFGPFCNLIRLGRRLVGVARNFFDISLFTLRFWQIMEAKSNTMVCWVRSRPLL